MGPILASLSSKIYQNKNLKELKPFTILPIKEVDQRATAVNLVELYQFCQGRTNLNPEARRKWLKSMVN
jgi:hypothetical protein